MGQEAAHTCDLGLAQASDDEIWDWALQSQAVIVTRDAELPKRVQANQPGPAVIWIRLPECSNMFLLAILSENWTACGAKLVGGQRLVEITAD